MVQNRNKLDFFERERAVLSQTFQPQIQLGAQEVLLGTEAGFLNSTTCWPYTRLTSSTPISSLVDFAVFQNSFGT